MDIVKRRQRVEIPENFFEEKDRKKIKKIIGAAKTCFYCIDIKNSKPFTPLPLIVREIDKHGNLWLFIPDFKNPKSKRKVIQLLFQGGAFSNFLLLHGSYNVSTDREKINDLQKSFAKEFKGIQNKKMTLIKVIPSEGYYWNSKQKKVSEMFTGSQEEAKDRRVSFG